MQFHTCPVCHSTGFVIPGQPPAQDDKSYFNKCNGKALTGEMGTAGTKKYIFDDSWRGNKTHRSELCGFPKTDLDGNVINNPITAEEYVEFCRGGFDPAELKQLVLTRHYKTLNDQTILQTPD